MANDRRVSVESPYYPYERVQEGFSTMENAVDIPLLICRYLMDLPLPGYTPPDNNNYPRCRLMKRLWYDGVNPLGQPLPTPQEKLSMLFDGDRPSLNTAEDQAQHPKGYRIYPLQGWLQSQLEAQTSLKIYVGREIPLTDFVTEISLIFDIFCNANFETGQGSGGLSKSYAMEKDIMSALHGVNIAGIGVVTYSRMYHGDTGSRPYYDENGTNVGRRLVMSLRYAEGGGESVQDYQNLFG